MAIKKDINLETGINIDGAYCRVENITIDKQTVSFNLRKYVDTVLPFFNEAYYSTSYNIKGENPYVQAYEYLKTLEEFKDAKDC